MPAKAQRNGQEQNIMNDPNIHIDQNEWELIEDYLLEKTTPEQTESIRQQILSNEFFAEKVEIVRLTLLGIREQSLSENISKWHSEISEIPVIPLTAKKENHFRKYLSAAAVLLLVIVAAWWSLMPSKEEKLIAKYYKPDPGLPTVMSISDNYEFEKAMVDYKTKNYDAAIQTWQSILTQSPDSDTLNFFIGNAYLANNEAAKSISFLEKVTQDPKSIFQSEAYWYLGIAYLKEKKYQEAKSALELSGHDKKKELISLIPR